MTSVILKITITPQSVIMNTTQNAIDANFSQNYFVKLGQLLAVLTVAQKNETRRSMKCHNQNAVRDEILKNLDARAVLMVMDWAMKFLARKFCESQSDWFGKCGIFWLMVKLNCWLSFMPSKAVISKAPLYSPLLMTSFLNLRKSCQRSTLFICEVITQDANIARLYYFQSIMLPASMQLN